MSSASGVLVTGASSGIGEAIALRLAELGYRVFAGVRQAGDAERLARVPSVFPVRLDVTDDASVASAVEVVRAGLYGAPLAGLVNNAGIVIGGPLEYIRPDELRTQLDVNVIGLHAVTTAFLPLIRSARGRIVHIGSISGLIASPFTGPYAASKHAVEALTDALRVELLPDGIHVAVIEPGQVNTPIWTKGKAAFGRVADRIPEEGLARYRNRLRVLEWMVDRAPRHSAPPSAVADAVVHALEAAEPRTRYVVGRDAKIRLWLSRVLPDRWMDAVVMTVMRRAEARLS